MSALGDVAVHRGVAQGSTSHFAANETAVWVVSAANWRDIAQ